MYFLHCSQFKLYNTQGVNNIMLDDLSQIHIIASPIVNNNNNEQPQLQLSLYHPQMHIQLLQQLCEYEGNLKAFQFYLTNLCEKGLKGLKGNVDDNERLGILGQCFGALKQETLIGKIKRQIIAKRFITALTANFNRKMEGNLMKIRNMTAQNCYQRCLKVKIFHQWRTSIVISKKQTQLMQYLRRKYLRELISSYSGKKYDKGSYQIACSIGNQKIVKKYFTAWQQWLKISQIQKRIMKKQSKIFIKRLSRYCKFQKTFYCQLYFKNLLKTSLSKLALNKKYEKSRKHHQKSLLGKYFNLWVKAECILFYQKQQDLKKNEIVEAFMGRKKKIKLLYCFQKWKAIAESRRENRNKITIAREYGQAKSNQYLLRKYFNEMKLFKLVNRADKYHNKKLKNKVFDGLRKAVLKAAAKLQSLYNYVQGRQRKRYFIAIKQFIEADRNKINKFRMQKQWNRFTFAIVKNYLQNNRKADNYHAQNLKFKVIYGLKLCLDIKAKKNRAIIFINANMNLRRWMKHYRIRQFVRLRKCLMLSKIFREMKLMRMNKVWSMSSRDQTGKMKNLTEDSIQFYEQIKGTSPSKLLSLDYSISGYNSNRIFDQF